MNTTVWLISFTTSNGEWVQKVHTHNCVADYRLIVGGATVQEIDCAAAAELIEAAKMANGDHSAPHDCYATGPLTGDPVMDLVVCPGCRLAAALARCGGAK